MKPQDVLAQARDALTVRRVFGEPYEKDGVTVVAVASVRGGAGAGGGGRQGEEGSGGGFGLNARPVGVYVIRGEQVSWQPAVDVTRIVVGGQLLLAAALLLIRSIVRSRARSR
ncbi:MAG TPA: spore germination protein GerW family protein [Jatrophihabitantaceae bacterium]|jgi:uncharacterized spore protein YtfJ